MELKSNGIIGQSASLAGVFKILGKVAPTDSTVLVTGESGTGKELLVRALHAASPRADRPFVPVNCGAIPRDLLESELFGHEKGAFTHALRSRPGRFELADGGTIFLDEIGEMEPGLQVKILRVLQEKEIERVGGTGCRKVDVRIVAATNRDLAEEIRAGRFREDLYYRLNVVSIMVPSLAERREDIPLLAQHFLHIHGERNRKDVKGFTPLAMDMLLRYDWPGNVRELENAVERAVVLLFGQYVSERELPQAVVESYRPPQEISAPLPDGGGGPDEPRTLEDVERDFIIRTVRECGDNKSEAAKRLGISRKTLHTKLKSYGLSSGNEE